MEEIILTSSDAFVPIDDDFLKVHSFPDHKGRPGKVGGSLPRDINTAPGVKDRKAIKDWNPREWGGMRSPPRFVMVYPEVVPVDDPAAFKQVYDAWAKHAKGNILGTVAYDTIIKETGLTPATVFGVIKKRFLDHQDVVFTVDRMGGGSFFHLKKLPKTFADFDPAKHPRQPAGDEKGGEFAPSRTAENYAGILKVSFAPNTVTDAAEIQANKLAIDKALALVKLEAVRGLNALYVTGGSNFLGSASYSPKTSKRGYVSDEISLMDGWRQKSPDDKVHTLIHEIAHRIQNMHPTLFNEFKKAGLGTAKDFRAVTLSDFADNYEARHHAGETFAESYARFKLNMEQPDNLKAFWSKHSSEI